MTILGPLQLWGALGMVDLTEQLRPLAGLPGRLGRSLPLQWAVMAALVAGMAAWSLGWRNAGRQWVEQRQMGQYIASTYGSGRRLLSSTPQAAWYSNGRFVSVTASTDPEATFTPARLCEILRDHRVDFVLYETGEPWSQWLDNNVADSPALLKSLNISTGKNRPGKYLKLYLLDAHRLEDELCPPASASSPNRE
jgi:hypothetical protein